MCTIVDRQLLQMNNAVRDRMQLKVVVLRREIIEQDDRRIELGKEVLQREYLAPVTQGILGKQPQFGKAVEHDTSGVQLLHSIEHELDRLAQFHLRRMKH